MPQGQSGKEDCDPIHVYKKKNGWNILFIANTVRSPRCYSWFRPRNQWCYLGTHHKNTIKFFQPLQRSSMTQSRQSWQDNWKFQGSGSGLTSVCVFHVNLFHDTKRQQYCSCVLTLQLFVWIVQRLTFRKLLNNVVGEHSSRGLGAGWVRVNDTCTKAGWVKGARLWKHLVNIQRRKQRGPGLNKKQSNKQCSYRKHPQDLS